MTSIISRITNTIKCNNEDKLVVSSYSFINCFWIIWIWTTTFWYFWYLNASNRLMPLKVACHIYGINKMPSSINCDWNEEWSTFKCCILFSYFKWLCKAHSTKYKIKSTKIYNQTTGSRPILNQELASVTYVFTRVKKIRKLNIMQQINISTSLDFLLSFIHLCILMDFAIGKCCLDARQHIFFGVWIFLRVEFLKLHSIPSNALFAVSFIFSEMKTLLCQTCLLI